LNRHFSKLVGTHCFGVDLATSDVRKNNLRMDKGNYSVYVEAVVSRDVALYYGFLFFVSRELVLLP